MALALCRRRGEREAGATAICSLQRSRHASEIALRFFISMAPAWSWSISRPAARSTCARSVSADDGIEVASPRTRPQRSAASSRACGSGRVRISGVSPGTSCMRSSSTHDAAGRRATPPAAARRNRAAPRRASRARCSATRRPRSNSTAGRRAPSRPCRAGR